MKSKEKFQEDVKEKINFLNRRLLAEKKPLEVKKIKENRDLLKKIDFSIFATKEETPIIKKLQSIKTEKMISGSIFINRTKIIINKNFEKNINAFLKIPHRKPFLKEIKNHIPRSKANMDQNGNILFSKIGVEKSIDALIRAADKLQKKAFFVQTIM
jgi:hypothetical protein